ncbi:Txe/YoeB family addiction module toxin [Dyadobacter sp. 3J3]|uniref:Txe/YoeB family addiction module toxin n=1 Tax=Dyadobacter sp. 3J3 TaxID=2606600 RepID=UPI001358188D|nr:Txe/YoeB family addiction module toxin [Dyadobacter sp. 3J3]
MEIIFLPDADDDLKYWVKSGNKVVLKKISSLIKSIQDTPFEGLGKPEGLKHNLSGLWSRRINQEHRLIYEIEEEKIFIHSLKGHY